MRRSIILPFGLTALLIIVAISSFSVWRNARNAQTRIAALHEGHTRAGDALNTIRANVYLIGVLTRDYLLDQDPARTHALVEDLNRIREATEEKFRELESSAQDNGQRLALKKLRSEFEAYWDPTEITLDWTPAEKRAQRAEVLRERVRKREEVVGLATQVEALTTANFRRERERITSADREFRASSAWTMSLALLLGVAVAAATLVHMTKLERHSALAESELRRLSGQIRSTQEQERRHLSRELHDQVGQMLTGLRMELASIARLHGDTESELSSRIARTKGTVEQTLRIVRNIAMLLRPSMLDDLGLTPAIAWLVKDMSRSSGIEIGAEIDPVLDALPDAHRTCLFRVIQEALTNAIRHSAASSIDVVLNVKDRWVIGVVSDNGRGFEKQRGLGLIGMEERARELGGDIQIESAPGRGTRITVRLPYPARPEETNDTNSDSGRSRDRADRAETAV
ncbi:MAG: ATP-binding protein [Acidobacteriota bacterium]